MLAANCQRQCLLRQDQRLNLINWIDTVAIFLDLQNAMVFHKNNQHVPASFHHLSPEDTSRFRWVLQNKTRTWHQSATTSGLYYGSFLEAGGEQGSGKGALFLSPFELGPFLGQ